VASEDKKAAPTSLERSENLHEGAYPRIVLHEIAGGEHEVWSQAKPIGQLGQPFDSTVVVLVQVGVRDV
jgi:hypothetical protein